MAEVEGGRKKKENVLEKKKFTAIGLTPQGQKMKESSEKAKLQQEKAAEDSTNDNTVKLLKGKKRAKKKETENKNSDSNEDDKMENTKSEFDIDPDLKIQRDTLDIADVPVFVRPHLVTETSDKNKDTPKFLLCPLCKDLLLDPLVLPCFHTICGRRCIPKLSDDGYHVWCPQCRTMHDTHHGIDSLMPAETFSKMSKQIRAKMNEEAIARGEIPPIDDSTLENKLMDAREHSDVTCSICHKFFRQPVRLPCGHYVCKNPCATRNLMYNFKIKCPVCEKPTYLNGGVNSLLVDLSMVERVAAVTGQDQSYVESESLEDSDFGSPNGPSAPPAVGEELSRKRKGAAKQGRNQKGKHETAAGQTHLIPPHELNSRLEHLDQIERQQQNNIPSLFEISVPKPPQLQGSEEGRFLPPPTMSHETPFLEPGAPPLGQPTVSVGPIGNPETVLMSNQPPHPPQGMDSSFTTPDEILFAPSQAQQPTSGDGVSGGWKPPKQAIWREGGCYKCGEEGHYSRECPNTGKKTITCYTCGEEGHHSRNCLNPGNADKKLGTCRNCGVEGHYSRECPQKKGSVNAAAGGKGWQQNPRQNSNAKRAKPQPVEEEDEDSNPWRSMMDQLFKKGGDEMEAESGEVEEGEDDQLEEGEFMASQMSERKQHTGLQNGDKDGNVGPIPHIPDDVLLTADEPLAAQIMGISWDGPKRARQGANLPPTNPKKVAKAERKKQTQLQGGRNLRHGNNFPPPHNHPRIPSLLDDLPHIAHQGPGGPMHPHEHIPMPDFNRPPPGMTGLPPPEMFMNHPPPRQVTPQNVIGAMLAPTGSGPPPIVNYTGPVVAPEEQPPPDQISVVPPSSQTHGMNLPPQQGMGMNSQPPTSDGQQQSMPTQMPPVLAHSIPPGTAPTSLPVMDPSTIPTMNSAFEYQAHWTKFVQQTMAYYNGIYASQGGTPPEAQTMINDYLSKCWAWYSAYTNLCLVNPEYKDVTKEAEKKAAEKQQKQQYAEPMSKSKKKKKNKQAAKAAAAKDNLVLGPIGEADVDPKEIEELKIMLLKKQLELKVKNARNKVELKSLLNMKKLVMEEEGEEEKVEEITEEEKEKVKEAALKKQQERAAEIERQEREREKDRDKEIRKLQEERMRERELEAERDRIRELKDRERYKRRLKKHDRLPFGGRRRRSNSRDRSRRGRMRRRQKSRSYSRSNSRSLSRSRSMSRSRSRSRSSSSERGRDKEEHKDEEPKYIKVSNLPDEVKAVELKSFVEGFGRVLNCKIGKMQGEMMAVIHMASLADAMSCVRDMHGSHFKGKILDIKYMGNKPNMKEVEVSLPDVYSGPRRTAAPASNDGYQRGPPGGYGYDNQGGGGGGGGNYYNRGGPEMKHMYIHNLPWGVTEDNVMRLVSQHARALDCRIGKSDDPNNRCLYATVTMESYIDVLRCINSLHGVRYEGRVLDVKKMKY